MGNIIYPKFEIDLKEEDTTIRIYKLSKNFFKIIKKKKFDKYNLDIIFNIKLDEKEGYYYFENEEDKYKNFFKNANDEIISIFKIFKKSITYIKKNLKYYDGFMYYEFNNTHAFEFYRNNRGNIENIITFLISDNDLFFLNNIEKTIHKMEIINTAIMLIGGDNFLFFIVFIR